ncbi:MAG: 6-carboxytetrahydropterin synthase [Phycisphaerales bacterium]|nr:6-carboxytetrahydropterin synthase [Phycisphaerales bacterium]
MYEISVHGEFCAAHALSIAGVREAVHGHNWRVTLVVSGEELDPDGLLCDFHTIERTLREVLRPMNNQDLNSLAPFDKVNPSAEHVARYIYDEMHVRLDEALAPHASVSRVSITEAPGCVATFRPKGSAK